MQQTRRRDVVDVLAAPTQKAQVFDALDRAADERIRRPRLPARAHRTCPSIAITICS